MDTLALDYTTWDLTLDAMGNMATLGDATPNRDSTGPGMRLAQDVATRCLAWRGEVYYDSTQGVRYPSILGEAPNLSVLQNAYQTEALKVPGCAQAVADFTYVGGSSRKVSGSVYVTDTAGNAADVLVT